MDPGLVGLPQAAEHQALACQRVAVFRIEREQVLEYRQRGLESVHAAQRIGRVPQQLGAMEARRGIVGQREDVARPAVQLRQLDTRLPVGEHFAEVLGARRLDVGPVDRLEADHLLVDRAADRVRDRPPARFAAPGPAASASASSFVLHCSCGSFCSGQEQLAVVFEGAIRGDVERPLGPAAMNHEHAARRHAVPDAELVEHVGVENEMSATTTSAVTSSKNMSVRMSPAPVSLSARNGTQPAFVSAGAMS